MSDYACAMNSEYWRKHVLDIHSDFIWNLSSKRQFQADIKPLINFWTLTRKFGEGIKG